MSVFRLRVAFLISLLAAPGGVFAQTKPLELKWSELAPIVTGHSVTITLTDGTAVGGEAVAVREDAILVDVATAVKGYAKGSGVVPRNSITLIDLKRNRGGWGRTLGTVIGALAGLSLGGYVIARNLWSISGGQAAGTFAGLGAAGALAGYFSGRAIDKRVTRIKIVP